MEIKDYGRWKEEQLKNPEVKKEYDALEPKFGKIRKGLKRISDKRKAQMPEYNGLIARLRSLCDNKSELSGDAPDWQTQFLVEPHHIYGRVGKLFLEPLNIIMLTRGEHTAIEEHRSDFSNEDLEWLVYTLRREQGFIKEV